MPLPIEPGQVIGGKYKVERVLGEGGMGIVLMAHDLRLERTVAIKFLLPELARQKEAAARFLREARACVKIQSEHIARVIDVDVLPDETPYMVMEYIEGRDLERTITERGPLPVSDVALWVIQACEAIAEAHAQRIVHRDLKPANLFLARQTGGSESVKVLDFGISKQTTAHGPSPSLTRTSAMLGSPLYMSPEQMRSTRDVDSRTDIWALGAILHEALSGRPPFEGESIPQLSAQILLDEPQRLDVLRPGVPKALADIVWRALRKDPADRFASVGELALALMPFAHKRAHSNLERIQRVLVAAGLMAEPFSLSDAPAAELPLKAVRITGHEATVPPSSPAPAPGSAAEPSVPARSVRSVAPKGRTMGNFGQTSDSPKQGASRLRLALGLAALLCAGGAVAAFWPRASSAPPSAPSPAAAPATQAAEVRPNATSSELPAANMAASAAAAPAASATVTIDNGAAAAAPSGVGAQTDAAAAIGSPVAVTAPAASIAAARSAARSQASPARPPRAGANASSTSSATTTRRVQKSETTTYSGTFKSKFGSRK